jgi:biotin synthase-related radical SAM superfamily protein
MNISEFERNKPVNTFRKIKELEKLIKEEQIKTENLYANRIATLDTMLKSVHDLMESFKKGE